MTTYALTLNQQDNMIVGQVGNNRLTIDVAVKAWFLFNENSVQLQSGEYRLVTNSDHIYQLSTNNQNQIIGTVNRNDLTFTDTVDINAYSFNYSLSYDQGLDAAQGVVNESNTLRVVPTSDYWSLSHGNGNFIKQGTLSVNNDIVTLYDNDNTVFGTVDKNGIPPFNHWVFTPILNSQPTASDVDTKMGENFYELDLQTNIKKYFSEAFKFDGAQFEMDGDRIVGIKQSFIDNIAVDLTNIVNTSITTSALEADTATINQTLTALGIVSDAVETKKLVLTDPQGRKHEIHLGN